jgi:NADH-quinone oxidoreductase subunit J
LIPALFIAFAALLVGCSLMVILHKNPVTSALFLVLAFCSLAGIYLLLHAEFVAMVQIIVYAGAIMVLFLFVIMYLNLRRDVEHGVHIALRRGVGWALGIVLLVEGWMLLARRWAPGPIATEPVAPVGNTQAIGQELYTRYLFPFEITSMLLLVAMVGAVVIARGRVPHLGPRESAAGAAPAVTGAARPSAQAEDSTPTGEEPA